MKRCDSKVISKTPTYQVSYKLGALLFYNSYVKKRHHPHYLASGHHPRYLASGGDDDDVS